MSSSHRVFLAIPLPAALKTQLLSYQERLLGQYANPIAPENFHITLTFLGMLSHRKIETIIDGLQPLRLEPFEVKITNPVVLTKAKILAMAIGQGADKLASIKTKLESQLKRLDHFDIEKRKYLAHVSLFRDIDLNELTNSESKLPNFDSTFRVNGLSLFESELTKHGVRYHEIGHWPFQKNQSIKQQLLGL